jgi:hypothetical protein
MDETTLNRVIAARERANAPKIQKQIDDAINAAVAAAVAKTLETVAKKDPPAPPQGGGDSGTGISAAKQAEIDGQLNAFRKEAAEGKRIAEEERAKRLEAEQRIMRQEERSRLTDILSGGKDGQPLVRAEQLDDVVTLMLGRVVRDPDNGEILWRGDKWIDKPGADNSLNYMAVADGIRAWAESPKGKAYAPPASTTGGGTRRPQGGAQRGRGDEPASDAEVGSIVMGINRR